MTKREIYGGLAVIITIFANQTPSINFCKEIDLETLNGHGVNGYRIFLFNFGGRIVAKTEHSTSSRDCGWINLFAELPEDEEEAVAFLGALLAHAGDYWPESESTRGSALAQEERRIADQEAR